MQVAAPNDIKIYNLSCSKSLPDWLSTAKRKKLEKSDIDIRRRIELIQDFGMPVLSDNVKVSNDGQYILATGTYKPRVRCYEVKNLSLKFERCLDAEVVKFDVLSDDYKKLIFMHNDRNIEIHNQNGRYDKFRLPKLGRDFLYNPFTCDTLFVGASSEVQRFNLEKGCFMQPWHSNNSMAINVCALCEENALFACGGEEGFVDAFDSRCSRLNAVASLDVASCTALQQTLDSIDGRVSITSIKFRDQMHLGVGTSTGQVLLYDIRSSKPYLIKDHNYSLPIIDITFLKTICSDSVLSMDSNILKFWDHSSGMPITSIEPGVKVNSLCSIPQTGMFLLASDSPKILTYFVPAMGPAPKWCAALESITEELEETQPEVFDDYKFLTRAELDSLGLDHLIGSDVLRAYMHGYFIDVRLYQKAKSIADPMTYEALREKKIRNLLDEQKRESRVKLEKDADLPKVNRELAMKLTGKNTPQDSRFTDMFKNADFEIDPDDESYQRLQMAARIKSGRKEKNEAKGISAIDSSDEASDNGDDAIKLLSNSNQPVQLNDSDEGLIEPATKPVEQTRRKTNQTSHARNLRRKERLEKHLAAVKEKEKHSILENEASKARSTDVAKHLEQLDSNAQANVVETVSGNLQISFKMKNTKPKAKGVGRDAKRKAKR